MFYLSYYQQIICNIIIISLFIIYLFYKYSFLYWKRKGVTYLNPTVLFGNIFPLVNKQVGIGEFSALMYNKIKPLNRYFGGYYILYHPIFLPIDLELIKNVLISDFQNFHDRGFHINEEIDPLSANIVNLTGERWKKSRLKFSPTFNSGKIKIMLQDLLACSEELDSILEEFCETQEPIDITDILSRLTVDNIVSCGYGLKCNSLKNPDTEFRKYGMMFSETTFKNKYLIGTAIYLPYLLTLFKIPLTHKYVTKFFFDAIKQTVDYRETKDVNRKDFIDQYIKVKNNDIKEDNCKAGDTFPFNELVALAAVFYVGGFETTSNTLTFGLYELSLNQDIQNKIRQEILKVLDNYKDVITYEAIMEMTYMDKVIKEILRKYPPIPMIHRECNKSYKVPGTDVIIDKGVGCIISILGIHMDPEYYPEPEKFDPERFSEEETRNRHPFSYLPFGEGPRICIGKRFGLLQMKVCFVKLFKSYAFTIDSKKSIPLELNTEGAFLEPKNKIWLRCSKL